MSVFTILFDVAVAYIVFSFSCRFRHAHCPERLCGERKCRGKLFGYKAYSICKWLNYARVYIRKYVNRSEYRLNFDMRFGCRCCQVEIGCNCGWHLLLLHGSLIHLISNSLPFGVYDRQNYNKKKRCNWPWFFSHHIQSTFIPYHVVGLFFSPKIFSIEFAHGFQYIRLCCVAMFVNYRISHTEKLLEPNCPRQFRVCYIGIENN